MSFIYEFENYVKKNYDISLKNGWGDNAQSIIVEYYKNLNITYTNFLPAFKNSGFWFIPSAVLVISLIKQKIKIINNDKLIPLILCSFSEFIRYISNTRNGEFKLYRIKAEKVKELKFDYIKVFTEIIKKNIKKMEEYTSVLNNQSSINVFDDNCMEILSIDDDSIDLVITSPPYGDSRTTVAYGQFSRLSSEWLGLIENENIDKVD